MGWIRWLAVVMVGTAPVALLRCVSDAPPGSPDSGGMDAPNNDVTGDGPACATGDQQCDPVNCGAANHDCLGGACAKGKCQPVMLATGQLQPLRIATDGDFVYWVNLGSGNGGNSDGSVMRVRKDGTMLMPIAQNQSAPIFFFIFGANIFWNNAGTGQFLDGTIVRAPVTGGAITTLYNNVAGTPSMTSDGTSVFWHGGGAIFRGVLTATNNSPAPVAMAAQPGLGGTIGLDSTRVFWAALSDTASLSYALKSGGPDASVTTIGVEQRPFGMVADMDAGIFYWANYTGGTIRRMPFATLDAGTIIANQPSASSVAVDDKYVYWWAGQQLSRINRDGTGAPETVATYPPGTFGNIALDDKAVYVAHRSGFILKVAKP